MLLEPKVGLEPSMARLASDLVTFRMLLLHVESIDFHAHEHLLAFLTSLLEHASLLHWRVFLSHVQLERLLPVEDVLAMIALSLAQSPLNDPQRIVMGQVMLFQIVVTFGSVWTKCAEELRLGLV